jgi:hypothetical protein
MSWIFRVGIDPVWHRRPLGDATSRLDGDELVQPHNVEHRDASAAGLHESSPSETGKGPRRGTTQVILEA